LNVNPGDSVSIVDAHVELFVLFVHNTIPGSDFNLVLGGSALGGTAFEATSAVFDSINVGTLTTCHELDCATDFLTTLGKFRFCEPAGFNFFWSVVVDVHMFRHANIAREGNRLLLWLLIGKKKGVAWEHSALFGGGVDQGHHFLIVLCLIDLPD
jgi:hypothetical protein